VLNKIINTLGTRTAIAILSLVIAIIISQILGTDGKGTQGLIVTTIAFLLVFANLIGGATLVYLTPRHSHTSLLVPSYIWSVAIAATGYFVIGIFNLLEAEYIIHVCILSVINSFTSVNSSLLIGRERIGKSNLVNFLIPFITAAGLFVQFFILEQRTIYAYLTSLYFAFGIALVVSLVFLYREFGSIQIGSIGSYSKVLKDLFRFGFLNQIAHITQMLSFRLSYYVLDDFHGEASVGIYSNAIQLAESIWLISKSISLVQYARIANTKDNAYATTLTIGLLKGAFLISLILILPLLILPVSFYTFIFGSGFEGVKPALWFLAPGVIIYSFSILIGHYYSGSGRYNVNAAVSTGGLLVSIVLYYLLIPTYSVNGAGLATSLSYTFTSILFLFLFVTSNKIQFKALIPTKQDFTSVKNEVQQYLKKD